MSSSLSSSSTGLNLSYVIPRLESNNYSTWKTKMEMLLIRKRLWSIVCERRKAPAPAPNHSHTRATPIPSLNHPRTRPTPAENTESTESAELIKWEEDAEQATATIFLYLGDRAERHVQDMRDPVAIWKKLKEIYETRGFSARFCLWQKLFKLRISNFQSEHGKKAIEVYVDKCRFYCQQLRSFGAEVSTEIEASALLNGLDKSYESFIVARTQSLRQNGGHEVDVDQLVSQLLDEDRCRNAAARKRQRPECFDCGRIHIWNARHLKWCAKAHQS